MLQGLLPRKQHISQVEALACCLVPFNFPDLLKGKDVLWFIDNTSALKGVIGGHSSIADSARICSAFHLLMQKLDARVWAEHVESAANIADEPSRELARSRVHQHIGGGVSHGIASARCEYGRRCGTEVLGGTV